MNTKSFRRIIGGLLGGSLPIAAVLSGQLACDMGRCYPAGDAPRTEEFELPPYMPPGGSDTDGGIIVGRAADGGTTDGGTTDGGTTDGGTAFDMAVQIPSLEEQCAAFCQDKSWRSGRPSNGSELSDNSPYSVPGRCICSFEIVHYNAQCIPPGAIEGRRPAGFDPVQTHGKDALGKFFARALQAEAASVAAFRILAHELRVHRAPAALIQAALRAAAEEVGHARLTHTLVQRFSGQVVWPEINPREPRSLWEVAVENEIEGCVNEAYSAFVAAWQARTAADPWVRAVMAVIAPEEAGHAELAFAISDWMRSRLDRHAQKRLGQARAAAIGRLQVAALVSESTVVSHAAGLPSPASAQTFLGHAAKPSRSTARTIAALAG